MWCLTPASARAVSKAAMSIAGIPGSSPPKRPSTGARMRLPSSAGTGQVSPSRFETRGAENRGPAAGGKGDYSLRKLAVLRVQPVVAGGPIGVTGGQVGDLVGRRAEPRGNRARHPGVEQAERDGR